MDFTRQPIIETIITPREGFRLVIRSSKNMGQEELFVDAIEVVSFGASTLFFRSTERPKPFLVPASDYEVLEVREQRLVLKTPSNNSQEASSSKPMRQQNDRSERREREGQNERSERQERDRNQNERQNRREREVAPKVAAAAAEGDDQEERQEGQSESQVVRSEQKPQDSKGQESRGQDSRGQDPRRRDRHRRRRGERGSDRNPASREGAAGQEGGQPNPQPNMADGEAGSSSLISELRENEARLTGEAIEPPPVFRAILPPPQTLIRDDLQRLRDNELYRGAFFIREEKEGSGQDDDDASLSSIDADSELHTREKKEAPQQGESFRPAEEYAAEVHSNPPIPLP